MKKNIIYKLIRFSIILILLVVTLTGIANNATANDSHLPIITEKIPNKPVFRISGNRLEELVFEPGTAEIRAVDSSKGKFKAIGRTKAVLRIKNLSPKQTEEIKSSIANGSFSASNSITDWDQAHTIEVTVTQYFRYKKIGDLYLVHFDTTNMFVVYKDPQVYAQSYFISYSFGRKYRENYDGTFSYVTTNSFYEKGRTFYGISQGSNYSDYNGESLWTDCKPEYSYEASQTHIDISASGSSWSMYIDFKFAGEEMHVITGS